MTLYIPIPFLYVQADVELRKSERFDEFEIYIVLMIYACNETGELKRQLKLDEAIKQFMNLDYKFYNFVEKKIKDLIEKNVILIENNQELSSDLMIGYFGLDEKITSNLKQKIFNGFSILSKMKSFYVYKNLIPLENWKSVNEEKINNLNIEINESLYNIEEEFFSFKNSIKSDLNDFQSKKSNDWNITNKCDFSNKKIIYIDFPFNFILDKNFLIPNDYSR